MDRRGVSILGLFIASGCVTSSNPELRVRDAHEVTVEGGTAVQAPDGSIRRGRDEFVNTAGIVSHLDGYPKWDDKVLTVQVCTAWNSYWHYRHRTDTCIDPITLTTPLTNVAAVTSVHTPTRWIGAFFAVQSSFLIGAGTIAFVERATRSSDRITNDVVGAAAIGTGLVILGLAIYYFVAPPTRTLLYPVPPAALPSLP